MSTPFLPNSEFIKAATLLPVFYQEGGLHLILTQRKKTLKHHAGQIAFPGGIQEANDISLWHTALRETEEEINLSPARIFYIETLPQVRTPTFFDVTPYVAFVHAIDNLSPNPDEIDHIFTVPLDHLRTKTHLIFKPKEYFGQLYDVPFFYYQDYEIWGATAKMILSLLEQWERV